MNDPNIVILAGGISSRMKRSAEAARALDARLRDAAIHKSKSMLAVGRSDRPFLDYLLYNIQRAGYRQVVLLIGEQDDSIREYYEREHEEHFPDLQFSFVIQPIPAGRIKPMGTADALERALVATPQWQDGDFTVCNSDNLYSIHALRMLRESRIANAMIDYDMRTLEFPRERILQFSVTKKDKDGYLEDIIEKPTPTEIDLARDTNGWIGVSMNIFRFSFQYILPYLSNVPIHPVRKEKELPGAVKMIVKDRPRSLITYPLSEHVPDLTSVDDIPAVRNYLEREFRDINL